MPALCGLTLILLLPLGCSDDDPASPGTGGDGPGDEIHIDEGHVGVIVDTRPIFRQGYLAATAAFAFADHAGRDATLDIDPTTNLAVLAFDTDELSEDELTAFAAGVALHLTIRDHSDNILAEHDEAALVLDDSNRPLAITTTLPYVPPLVALRETCPT